MPYCRGKRRAGLTIIELLCTIGIIMILAALLAGPASRVLVRLRADKWSEDANTHLQATVEQLRQRFQGRAEFAPVTLGRIEAEHLVGVMELHFLKDARVTFIPFAGSDPDEKVIIRVKVDRGHWTEAGVLTETKGTITKVAK